jgi:hypothetical protein
LAYLPGSAWYLYGDHEFYKIYNGTSIAVNIGIDRHFKNNLIVGLRTNFDYLIKSKDLHNHFGRRYSSYETSLNIGYGRKSKRYLSYSAGVGYNINPGKYPIYDDFGNFLVMFYRHNSLFGTLNANYNVLICQKLYLFGGVCLKSRVEKYGYRNLFGQWPDPYWGNFVIPSVNFGLNLVL